LRWLFLFSSIVVVGLQRSEVSEFEVGSFFFFFFYLYNILGWSSFPSICPVKRPSKFFIPEVEDNGTGGGRRLMAATTDNPQTICAMMPNLNSGFCLKRFLESSKSVP
jgi:hypothetical protein